MSFRSRIVLSLAAIFIIQPMPFLSAERATAIKAPDFSGGDTEGTQHALADYQGRPLVLYFWATWCPACVQDIENMKRIHHRYRPEGIEFVTVSLDRDLERLKNFIQRKKIPYPVLFSGKGWHDPVANQFGVSSTPTFVIISPDGYLFSAGYWSDQLMQILERLDTAS